MATESGIVIPAGYGYWSGKQPQQPPSGQFNSDDIYWFCEEAMIPACRLKDFVEGEGNRPKTSCAFTHRKIDDPDMVTGKKTVRFWCCFGPKDLREKVWQEIPAPTGKKGKGKGSRPWAARKSLGTSEHRGFQSHFHAIFYKGIEEVVVIKWVSREHLDMAGLVCHGVEDPTAVFGNALIVPRISEKCRDMVDRLLRTGVQPVDILLEHQKVLKELRESTENNTIWPRDAQLCLKDILNIQQGQRKAVHNYHSNDAVSTEMWIEQNLSCVVFHQRRCEAEKRPFILTVASEWMLETLARLGHNNAVAFDATFGSNCYGYSFYTLICFDEFQNGIPCCWALVERHEASDVELILSHVKQRVQRTRESLELEGDWSPSCFIVDDAKEEQIAVSHVFPSARILLCLWHVRRAWIKQLHAKVSNPLVKADMNRALGSIMYATEGAEQLSVNFMQEFKQEKRFIDYYLMHWHSRLQKWAKQYRGFKHNNQNTNGAVERWHRTLKVHLRASRKGKSSRRISWLLHVLFDKIENYYWIVSVLKRQGRIRNSVMHRLVQKGIKEARSIPDDHVTFDTLDGKRCGFVQSQSKPNQVHEVTNFDTDIAGCTCSQGAEGNICKHQIKCLLMSGYSEVLIVQRLGTLAGTLAGGLEKMTQSEDGHKEAEDGDFTNLSCIDLQEDCLTIVHEQPARIMSEDDAMALLRRTWSVARTNSSVVAHATTMLQDLHERVLDLAARNVVLADDQTVETFNVISGTDGSLKRRPDFVERFMKKKSRTAVDPQSEHVSAQNVEDFLHQPVHRESMQAVLDRAALQAIDLNIEPSEYTDATRKARSNRKGHRK